METTDAWQSNCVALLRTDIAGSLFGFRFVLLMM